jgi:hypothetical protein
VRHIFSIQFLTTRTALQPSTALVDLTVTNQQDGVYYETFYPKSLRDTDDFSVQVGNVFSKISSALDDVRTDYTFEITRDGTTPMCKDKYFAHMNDKHKRMNFCNRFFNDKAGILPTQTRLDNCDTISLREAQFSRSAVMVHELTHTGFAMDPNERYKYFHLSQKTPDTTTYSKCSG